MIFGITLKHFAKLHAQGDKAKPSKRIERLLQKTSGKRFKTKTLSDIKFSDFVDLERYLTDSDFENFCAIFVQTKFWQTIYVHNMTLIVEDYAKQKKELFEQYQYIFNPPQYGEPEKESIGSELRKEFVQEFGNWVVLSDVVGTKQHVSHKELEQWEVSRFLFWANYYSGQKIIENVK